LQATKFWNLKVNFIEHTFTSNKQSQRGDGYDGASKLKNFHEFFIKILQLYKHYFKLKD